MNGVPTLNVAGTLFSLAAAWPRISYETTANAADEAIRDGKATDGWLRSDFERIRCRGRNGVRIFEKVLDARVDAPTASALERHFLELVDRYDLPRPASRG